MSVYQLSNDDLLTLGARVLNNSEAPPVKEAVASVGYDEAALEEGRALFEAFEHAMQKQETEYGEQLNATEALNDAWDAFHSHTYMPHVTIARLVFEDPGTRERLGLVGRRPEAFGAYVQTARRFYEAVARDEGLQSALAERGVEAETIAAAQDELERLETLDQTQEREKAEAQQATRARNDARRSFADWLSDFQKFARVALSDQPDLLEQLGLTIPVEA